ncbi:MAG TPA: bifunctional phosphopantothenoylcysteine decarboxylase/phosphopantothenate--cysteine ligase CoaBC [Chitinophagaceae bacterium]
MLDGKKILLGITGSIAAYKSILLVRLLVKAGAEVRVIMTPSAKSFVSPLVLSTLSGNKVLTDLFDEDTWANHVMLGRWADVMLIAPLSCNTLSKMASGQCDNLLLAVYLSATCPVVVSPAMDEDMWRHPSSKRNIELLESYGNSIIDVETGELASGLFGEGRMAEPETIVQYLSENFFRSKELNGKKVLVTAGPTHEAIDPVRFISNHSSGKMGFALAEAFYIKGADVQLVTGPTNQRTNFNGIKVTHVVSAEDMYNTSISFYEDADITVMSAAIADYKPETVAAEKIKKTNDALTLPLSKTKDVLKELGEKKKPNQLLIGFALETSNEREYALKKLRSKNADMIVLNSLRDANAGFGYDTNKVVVFDKDGYEHALNLSSKQTIAQEIVNLIIQKINA